MGEPAAVATAQAFLDGHLGITLPPETHAQLTADHVRLAAVDHSREPLIETAWLGHPLHPAHSYGWNDALDALYDQNPELQGLVRIDRDGVADLIDLRFDVVDLGELYVFEK